MPIKRTHRKSRYGCDQCRKRRVKCDEKAPRCTNCVRREEDCAFSRKPIQSLEDIAQISRDGAQLEASNLLLPEFSSLEETNAGLSEAALMHHWCTRTCHSFTPRGADLFREYVGKEALRHEYLMESLLALTLLHMAIEMEDPATAQPLVSAALRHQNRSLLGLGEALKSISPSNCDSIFACGLLIMPCAVVSSLLPTSQLDQPKPAAESIILLVGYMNGISHIVQTSRKWILDGPLSLMFCIVEPEPPLIHDEWPHARELRSLLDATVDSDSQKHSILEEAINGLGQVHRRHHCAVMWIVRVSSAFLDEIRNGDPLALAVLMHWGVLLYTMDDMWWKRYSGVRLVEEVSNALDDRGEEWEAMTRRCREQVLL